MIRLSTKITSVCGFNTFRMIRLSTKIYIEFNEKDIERGI
jgi:hypothetical protein